MPILTRKPGESIVLEHPELDQIVITVLENGRVGIEAPEVVTILRGELCQDID